MDIHLHIPHAVITPLGYFLAGLFTGAAALFAVMAWALRDAIGAPKW